VLPVLGKVELGEELAALAFSAAGLNWTPWRQQRVAVRAPVREPYWRGHCGL